MTNSDIENTSLMGLFGIGAELTEEELKDNKRNDLANLLNSYADESDVFSEILQNAMDAVLSAREEGIYSADKKPELRVFLGRRSHDTHYFCVSDNGLGMDPDLAKTFTIPGKTAKKRQGKTIGHKGVGASFFVAASDAFAVKTEGSKGVTTEFTVRGANNWIRNRTAPEPSVELKADLPKAVKDNAMTGRGTTICYFFHSDWKPGSMASVVIQNDDPKKEIANWASYLCAKTSLGQIQDISDKQISVTFYLDRGTEDVTKQTWHFGEFDKQNRTLGYPYPHQVFKVAKDVNNIDQASIPQRDKMRNSEQAVKLRWTAENILNGLTPAIEFDHDERRLVDEHLEFVDLFYCYSTKVMDEVRKRIGSRASVIRYGIKLAVDGVPQARMMDFSLTSNQGLDRQLHALFSFKNLTLDMGRKIPSDEQIADVVRKISTRLVGHIKDYRIYLKKPDRQAPSHNLDEWRKEIIEQKRDSHVDRLFEIAGNISPIQVDPQNENDTIALFSGLVASSLIKGLKLASLSGYNAYDGLIDIAVEGEQLQDPDNPLAIGTVNSDRAGLLRVIEFKHRFMDVLDDFESGKKDPRDIDLLVCWDLPSMRVRRGACTYWYEDRSHLREIYGATHLWTDENNSSDMVIMSLKHVVSILLRSLELDSEDGPGIGAARLSTLIKSDKQDSI